MNGRKNLWGWCQNEMEFTPVATQISLEDVHEDGSVVG